MINLKLTIVLLAFTTAAVGQKSTFLKGKAENPVLRQHLEAVNQKWVDTTYIYSAIPEKPFTFPDKNNATQHFPYPIIFIHGLGGAADSWIEFYNYALEQGWSYGGHLRFNLNTDSNFSFSNIYSATKSDITDFNENIPAADFYLVNFNCALDGASLGKHQNTSTQSNQAAVAKQGWAIGQAIRHVLEATGKDKVILVGHSMGGLAARQYLQNPDFWQSDGDHHLAKLVTSGTPHGGSNVTGPGFSQLFFGIDEGSDAVRDLRRSYFYSGDPGVYLYGGRENPSVMNDRLAGFQDYDVNCNGAEGNEIKGLNEKDLYTDLDFSCIIGTANPLGGDYAVGLEEAQLKSYYDILSETFKVSVLHTRLPEQTRTNFEAFDEPDLYDLSYQIDKNTDYHGFVTAQAPDALYQEVDYDDFVFTTTETGWLSVMVDNIDTASFGVSILRHPDYQYVFDEVYQLDSIRTEDIELPPGTYYLEFYAKGNSTSWQYPYYFRLDWRSNLPTPVTEVQESIRVDVRPNPVSGFAFLRVALPKKTKGTLQLYNELGQRLYERSFDAGQFTEQIDMQHLPAGIYFLKISTMEGSKTVKVLKGR